MNKTNAIYVRTANPNEEGKASLRSQIEQCKQYAKENGYSPTHLYEDQCSSTLTDSTSLQKLLQAVTDGNIQTIITPNPTRFTRNVRQHNHIYNLFHEHNVKVLTLS